jgi:serine/threonine protein kinase
MGQIVSPCYQFPSGSGNFGAVASQRSNLASLESLTKLPRAFGPFTLIRLIAQGGMGQVFLALRPVEHEPTDEVCVVKTVRTDLRDDREAVGRFLDEARIVQKLDHPNICHTLDAGVIQKTYYVALEFISGRNLRDVQTRAQKLGKQVPDSVLYHSLMSMLDALQHAHAIKDPSTGKSLCVVHRDVSPHNVMLGFDGYVKLIDFGLAAHTLKREMTRPGIMVGKLRYNAPEQVRDRALDGRSDLYSAGVMLYELVTGERFYEGLSEEEIWRVAMKGTYRPRGMASVPRDIRNVLELALAPEPEGRFESAAAMRDAVAELARARNVRDARRAAARFMGELFAEERQLERDMILQATGLAEARTRLFTAPKDAPVPQDEPSISSVGRTKVVSPAQLRGRLQSLVSSFDPNAETAYGEAPTLEPSVPDEMSSHSDPFRTSKPGEIEAVRAHGAGPSPMVEADTVVRPTTVSEPDPRPAAAAAEDAPRPEPRPTQQQSVMARPRGVNTSGPHRPSRSVDRGRLPWAALGAGAGVLLLAGVALAAWVMVPEPPKPRPAVRVEAPPAPEPPPPPVVVVDAGAAPAPEPEPTIAEALPEDPPPPPPPPVEVEKLEKVEKAEKKIEKKVQRPPPPPPRDEPPPQKPLKTLKEQVDYLTTYCIERVACARSAVEDAKNLVALSPEETKTLMNDIQKCIARCQR